MSNIYDEFDERHQIPILVQPHFSDVVVEIRTYGPKGEQRGAVYHIMTRKEAIKMAYQILGWAHDNPYDPSEDKEGGA